MVAGRRSAIARVIVLFDEPSVTSEFRGSGFDAFAECELRALDYDHVPGLARD